MSLVDVNDGNLYNLLKIAQNCLPVDFPLAFFKEVLQTYNVKNHSIYFSKLLMDPTTGYPVGCFKSKMMYKSSKSIVPSGLYIEVIAVFENYRNKQYGTMMLHCLESICKTNYLRQICAHVAVNNKSAIAWYIKNGFTKDQAVLPKYYTFHNGDIIDACIFRKQM